MLAGMTGRSVIAERGSAARKLWVRARPGVIVSDLVASPHSIRHADRTDPETPVSLAIGVLLSEIEALVEAGRT
jgi:hypothetical protein